LDWLEISFFERSSATIQSPHLEADTTQRTCHGLTLGLFAACLMRVDDASVCAGLRDGGMPLAADAIESNGESVRRKPLTENSVERSTTAARQKVTEGRKRQPFSDKANPRRSLTSHHRRELHILHQVLSKKAISMDHRLRALRFVRPCASQLLAEQPADAIMEP
jgi:hypothetical protein